jgi:hypothetical protein
MIELRRMVEDAVRHTVSDDSPSVEVLSLLDGIWTEIRLLNLYGANGADGGRGDAGQIPWQVEIVEGSNLARTMNVRRPYVRIGSQTVAATGTSNVAAVAGDWYCVADCGAHTAILSQTPVNDGTHESLLVFKLSSGGDVEYCNVSPQVEIWEAPALSQSSGQS